jgi:hypothetical protein
MKEIFSSVTFEIQPRETVRVAVARHAALAVCGTRIWVTRHRDVMDYWLAPGEKLALQAGDTLWVSAEGEQPARVVLTTPAGCEERLLRWLGGRLGGLLAGRKGFRLTA